MTSLERTEPGERTSNKVGVDAKLQPALEDSQPVLTAQRDSLLVDDHFTPGTNQEFKATMLQCLEEDESPTSVWWPLNNNSSRDPGLGHRPLEATGVTTPSAQLCPKVAARDVTGSDGDSE